MNEDELPHLLLNVPTIFSLDLKREQLFLLASFASSSQTKLKYLSDKTKQFHLSLGWVPGLGERKGLLIPWPQLCWRT